MSKGTSKYERMPEALDPESFNVDDRYVHDLFGEVQGLAEVLAFYRPLYDEIDGNRISMKNFHNRIMIQHCLFNALERKSTEVRLLNMIAGIKGNFTKITERFEVYHVRIITP